MSSFKNTSGGGAMHRLTKQAKKRQTYKEKKENAYYHDLGVLGEPRINNLQERWSQLPNNNRRNSYVGYLGDGILLCLKKLGLSCIEI